MKARNSSTPSVPERWVCIRAGSSKVSTPVWDWWMKAMARMPDQQEGRAGEGVDEELDGRVAPPGESPPADEEVGRHQGQLEEQEEQDQVEGDEAAHAGRLEQEHPGHERAGVAPGPGPEHGQREEHGRQHHQEQRDAVDARATSGCRARWPSVWSLTIWYPPTPALKSKRRPTATARVRTVTAMPRASWNQAATAGWARGPPRRRRWRAAGPGWSGRGRSGAHQPHHSRVSMKPRITHGPEHDADAGSCGRSPSGCGAAASPSRGRRRRRR